MLSDFLTFSIQTMYELSGRLYRADQITDWDLFQTFDPAFKHEFFYECGRRGVASSLEVCAGSLEGVARLRLVADIYIVTSPMRNAPFWVAEREAWLDKHFGIPHNHVVHTEAKHVCAGDVFVDDKPANVREWCRSNPDGVGLLWDAPYNRLERGLTRASDWTTVLQAVHTLTERTERGVLCEDSSGQSGPVGPPPDDL